MSRVFTLTLAQNCGDGSLGETLDLSGLVSKFGPLSWEVDEQLTKLSPGEFAPEILDYDGAVWAWLQTQTPVEGALYPPFLVLDVDGVRAFTGIVRPENVTRDEKSGVLTLQAQDWSLMLASNALVTWVRPSPKVATHEATRPDPAKGVSPSDEIRAPTSRVVEADTVCFEGPGNWIEVGDLLDGTTLYGAFTGKKVLSVARDHMAPQNHWRQPGPYPTYTTWVRLTGQVWPFSLHWQEGTFQRQIRTTEALDYYSVTAAVGSDPVREISLNTVDGIVPGDKLRLLNNAKTQSWAILQVDPACKKVVTADDVTELAVDDRIYFTEECAAEVVYEDVRRALIRACEPFACDLSRYAPPSLPAPVLTWLPLRPLTNSDLTSLKDLDSGLTNLRAFCSSGAWDGTPEAGWMAAAGTLPRAHWTSQLTSAPSSLMPDETLTLSPASPRRYRPIDLKYRARSVDAEDTAAGTITAVGTWSPSKVPAAVVHDYLQMRRVVIDGTAVSVQAWDGSAWGTATTSTWPGTGPVLSASVFPGGPSGMVLGLTAEGLRGALGGETTAVCTIQDAAKDSVLCTTPWGAFLVGSRGFGRITYNSGALAISWLGLLQSTDDGTVYPGTFAAVDATRVAVFVRFDSRDSGGNVMTETHLMLLDPAATTADAAVVWDEKIFDGAPITCGAFRDPSQSATVVGHCGGRLFQVAAKLPVAYALERFTPSEMNSAELLEHICQVIHAVAVPDASGVMQIISRSGIESVQALAVDQVEVESTRAWEHFYSIVRVAGATDDALYDARSAMDGGKLLEISKHPLLWCVSGCMALAQTLVAWFGQPRRLETQTWFWTGPGAAPWEGLQPLTRLTLNGGSTTWLLLSKEMTLETGEASVTLVEV